MKKRKIYITTHEPRLTICSTIFWHTLLRNPVYRARPSQPLGGVLLKDKEVRLRERLGEQVAQGRRRVQRPEKLVASHAPAIRAVFVADGRSYQTSCVNVRMGTCSKWSHVVSANPDHAST